MNSFEDYVRRWVRCGERELDAFSEWMQGGGRMLRLHVGRIRTRYVPFIIVFSEPEMVGEICMLHGKCVLVLDGGACGGIVFVMLIVAAAVMLW